VEAIGELARREIGPRVQEYDEGEYIPVDLLSRMAELGFFGGVILEECGGLVGRGRGLALASALFG
jgi:alkylation response protein AidB-like acyl-CoA dehydrogenase